MNKEFGILASVAVITIAIVIGVIMNSSKSSSNNNVWRDDAPIMGNANGKLKIVEFSDFQCPACAATAPIIKSLVSQHLADVGLEYRHYPLSQHPNAILAALAAEAAKKYGKFWEMDEILFANRTNWENSSNASDMFEKFAVLVGVDEAKYKADLQNKQLLMDSINSDKYAGDALNLPGTPSLFFNSVLYSGDLSESALKAMIDSYLQ